MSANTPSSTNTDKLGLTFALAGAFLFSLKPILIKWLYAEGMTALPLLWLRMALVLPLYLGLWVFAHKKRRKPVPKADVCQALAIGLLGYYLASFLDLTGLQYVSSQLERLVLYAYPSLVIVFGVLFFGQRWRALHGVALLLTYVGLAFMFGHDLSVTADGDDLIKGTGLIFASAISFAWYVLLGKGSITRLGSLLFSAISMSSACAATGVHYALVHGFELPPMTASLWVGCIVLAVAITFLPTLFINEAIHRIGPQRTGISGTIGPVFTTVLAALFLGEAITIWSLVGMALVMLGVSLLSKKERAA